MSSKKDAQKPDPADAKTKQKAGGFSAQEKAAMKERAEEIKTQSGGKRSKKDGEADVLEKIAEMPKPEQRMATRIHEIVKEAAPELVPKTWYGMPAYALGKKVVCFFQAATKFDARYSTLGFSDTARLDDGAMWPTAFAVRELTPDVESEIAALVKQAVEGSAPVSDD